MTEPVMPLRRPEHDREPPLRLVPQQGQPRCLLERVGQHVWHHKLLWYAVVVATLSLVLQFGVGEHLHETLWH